MFNLLPDNLKTKVRGVYRLHLVITVILLVLVLQISFLVFLFPSWLISVDKEKEILEQSAKSNKSSLDSQISMVNTTIKSINTKLTIFNTNLQYPKAVPFIDNIIAQKTNDIIIKKIEYSLSNQTAGQIIIAGMSANRDALVTYAKKLTDSKFFKRVDLPISNFTKVKDIDFSINMTLLVQ